MNIDFAFPCSPWSWTGKRRAFNLHDTGCGWHISVGHTFECQMIICLSNSSHIVSLMVGLIIAIMIFDFYCRNGDAFLGIIMFFFSGSRGILQRRQCGVLFWMLSVLQLHSSDGMNVGVWWMGGWEENRFTCYLSNFQSPMQQPVISILHSIVLLET